MFVNHSTDQSLYKYICLNDEPVLPENTYHALLNSSARVHRGIEICTCTIYKYMYMNIECGKYSQCIHEVFR